MSGAVDLLAGSGWANRPDVAAPALEGAVSCDVAVVGGGLGGMAAALRLAERGVDVVVLEADLCGWGASARSAGYLANTLAADPQLAKLFHRRRFPGLVRFADASRQFAENLIERLSIECEHERIGTMSAALSPAQLKRARRTVATLNAAGGHAELREGPESGLPHTFLGGAFEPGGLLNPGKYALGLRQALLGSGARVFEQTPVRAVDADGTGATVSTPAGHVRAERVLLTANAGSKGLNIAPRHLATPVWTSLVETEPITPERLDETGWSSRVGIVTHHLLIENYRPTQRNTIVFGTRQLRTARGRGLNGQPLDQALVADLVRGFRDRFPSLSDVKPQRAWGGWIGMTTAWLPVAGEANPRVLYALGCNGHGLAHAPYLGHLLADRLAGDQPHDDLQTVWRQRPRFRPSLTLNAPALKAAWALDRLSDRISRR